MSSINDSDVIDILYGAAAIGAAIGMTRRQAFYRLENGELPAKKIGRTWVGNRRELLAAIGQLPAAEGAR